MPLIKLAGLILYAFMAYVAITKPMTLGANMSTGILVMLVIAHLVECVIYREKIIKAPGSAAWHFLNVFLFGVMHMMLINQMLYAIEDEEEAAAAQVAREQARANAKPRKAQELRNRNEETPS